MDTDRDNRQQYQLGRHPLTVIDNAYDRIFDDSRAAVDSTGRHNSITYVFFFFQGHETFSNWDIMTYFNISVRISYASSDFLFRPDNLQVDLNIIWFDSVDLFAFKLV